MQGDDQAEPQEDFLPGTRMRPDPVIDFYKRDVDITLLKENLRLSPTERLRKFDAFMRGLVKIREGRP